jgi:hypothetical protein
MTSIISKRHIYKFYLPLILSTLCIVGFATGILWKYNTSVERGALKTKEKFFPFLSIAIYAFAGYTVYRYMKNAPKITLNKKTISFNKQTFLLSDIKELTLTGKRPFKYAISVPMEAARLTFGDNTTKDIFDDMYANSWEIKSFLKQMVIDKSDLVVTEITPIEKIAVATNYYETFKGHQLLSFRGISLWGLLGVLMYMMVTIKRPNNTGAVLFVCGISLLWFVLFSYQMHYFEVSDNFFVVRNHNFFWKKKAYTISDIQEIVFESQGKMPNSLRIITKDFRNKLYPAGTLRNKDWLALKDKLEVHNIKVRNEVI